jgi:hypothetical protein
VGQLVHVGELRRFCWLQLLDSFSKVVCRFALSSFWTDMRGVAMDSLGNL